MVAEPGPAHTSWEEFGSNNSSLVLVLLLVTCMAVGVYLRDRYWRHLQASLERATGIMDQCHACSVELAQCLAPSLRTAKYQFRGMQVRAGAACIGFEDLSLDLPGGARVLSGVTGEFQAGRMCAIMGPSGAGKTTFMNVLCGKATYGRVAGAVTLNGQKADLTQFRSITGFVPQDDIVHQDLTVREQIHFSARLRNSPDLSEARVRSITEDVLHVMQIEHIQNSVVGGIEKRGISGGQRKRVNIGLELAAQPAVMFLDEPTSGLDATSSLAVALSVKRMCQLGMTSIMVVHQPRYPLFTLFDDVLFLGKGGHVVYLGPSTDAQGYFEGLGFQMPSYENPADWFMDVISGEVKVADKPDFKPEMLASLWRGRAGGVPGRRGSDGLQAGPKSQEPPQWEQLAALHEKLEEEWGRADAGAQKEGGGALELAGLRQLLARCLPYVPADEVVREVIERVAGEGATSVTKDEMFEYLCGLCGDVAQDRKMQPAVGIRTLGLTGDAKLLEGRLDLEAGAAPQPQPFPERRRPGYGGQLGTLVARRLVQCWRMNRQRALYLVPLAMGATILAVTDRYVLHTPAYSGMSLLNLHSCLALLLAIFCLQVFGNDQPVFWRERARGLNVFAHFQARLCVNTLDIAVQVFVFTAVYFLIRQPRVPFWRFLVPFGFTSYAASGWGYLVSTLVPPSQGPFIVSLVVFVTCGLLGNPANLGDFLGDGILEGLVDVLSITRWSVAMSYMYLVGCLNPQPSNQMELFVLNLEKSVFSRSYLPFGAWWTPALALTALGAALRVAAFLGLSFRNQDKQV